MLNDLQTKAAQGARRAAWAGTGALMIGIGIGFLTVAAWLVLAALRDTQFAALVLGAAYVGFGAIAIFLAGRPTPSTRLSPPSDPAPASPIEHLAIAFIRGFDTGQKIRR